MQEKRCQIQPEWENRRIIWGGTPATVEKDKVTVTRTRLDELHAFSQAQGWEWRSTRPIQHGEQVVIAAGDQQVTVNFYPKRGKLVPGGADSPLKAAVTAWIEAEQPPTAVPRPAPAAPTGGTRLDALKAYSATQGWNWGPGATIPYGEQIIVADGQTTALVSFWPKRGRMQVQGSASPLKTALQAWVDAGEETPTEDDTERGTFTGPHIGMDESGKGDWFGPLVVAAVYVDAVTAPQLRRAGVRDSKELDAATLTRIATQIKRIVPPEQRVLRAIVPAEYNQLYARYGNINLLLADVYAQVAGQLSQALPSSVTAQDFPIVCDQFSQRADRLDKAFAAENLPRPTQQHHAEAASIAVAAASILASAAFTTALAELATMAGLAQSLPKGASDLPLLQAAGRRIISRHGLEGLGTYAKLNFKPVQELLGREA